MRSSTVARRQAEGQCIDCGGEPKTGGPRCEGCREKRDPVQRARRARQPCQGVDQKPRRHVKAGETPDRYPWLAALRDYAASRGTADFPTWGRSAVAGVDPRHQAAKPIRRRIGSGGSGSEGSTASLR